MIEIGIVKFDQHQPVLWQHIAAPLVVQPPLLAAGDTGHGCTAIEEWDCLTMLPLTIFDDQLMSGVKSIDRKRSTCSVTIRVSQQKRETVTAGGGAAQGAITQIDNIVLV
ncbi:hypothetical protein A0J57_13970 [Sphingobium sp. 22B]|nr:hypothetical protein AXW74_15075 [Sphingobium sp. AM]KYC31725.1 hypothetical protein A0J57_13970 [Sphingobium sp. 22B]OAP31047.1 hypothetical protein A8O16_15355 [Sphingobium sp. 20006FA]